MSTQPDEPLNLSDPGGLKYLTRLQTIGLGIAFVGTIFLVFGGFAGPPPGENFQEFSDAIAEKRRKYLANDYSLDELIRHFIGSVVFLIIGVGALLCTGATRMKWLRTDPSKRSRHERCMTVAAIPAVLGILAFGSWGSFDWGMRLLAMLGNST